MFLNMWPKHFLHCSTWHTILFKCLFCNYFSLFFGSQTAKHLIKGMLNSAFVSLAQSCFVACAVLLISFACWNQWFSLTKSTLNRCYITDRFFRLIHRIIHNTVFGLSQRFISIVFVKMTSFLHFLII